MQCVTEVRRLKTLFVVGVLALGSIMVVSCGDGSPIPPPAPRSATPVVSPTPTSAPESTPTPEPTSTPTPSPTPAQPIAAFSSDVESGGAPLTVQFNNTSEGPVTSVEWDFGDGETGTDESPIHRYTVAGTYSVQLNVSGPGGTNTIIKDDLIGVEPGLPVSLFVFPTSTTLAVLDHEQFTVVAKDEFGNVITDTPTWRVVAGGGSVDPSGTFTAGTVSGAFADTVTALMQNEDGDLIAATASVAIEPGRVARVAMEPAEINLEIGAKQPFLVTVFDEFDNEISDARLSWSLTRDVGVLDEDLMFTAGTKAGIFEDGIRLEVVKGIYRAPTTVDIGILPGPLALVEIQPSVAVLSKGDTQLFVASGVDRYWNEIPDLKFLWHATGGLLDQTRLFTADETFGRYQVTASASYKGVPQTASADIEIPGIWSELSAMPAIRYLHTATLLNDGSVLIASGATGASQQKVPSSAYIYDPVDRLFEKTAKEECFHGNGTATLLDDGRVLIAGGNQTPWCAEIYDPDTGKFTATGDLGTPRGGHSSTLLADGRVLLVGGIGSELINYRSAEVYDPRSGEFSVAGEMGVLRPGYSSSAWVSSTRLPNGEVLVAGGHFNHNVVELFDPVEGTFRVLDGISIGGKVKAILLNDGRALLVYELDSALVASLYNPVDETLETIGPLVQPVRDRFTLTLLRDDRVLIAGGVRPVLPTDASIPWAEIYDPTTGQFTQIQDMTDGRFDHAATLLDDGTVLITGGYSGTAVGWVPGVASAELLE